MSITWLTVGSFTLCERLEFYRLL